jgi:hypothetical protein
MSKSLYSVGVSIADKNDPNFAPIAALIEKADTGAIVPPPDNTMFVDFKFGLDDERSAIVGARP